MANVLELKRSWAQQLEIFAANSRYIDKWFDYLLWHYTTPARKYHTLNHIAHFLQLAAEVKVSIGNWPGFYLAIWFHDVIQNHSTGNEVISASKCREAILDLGLNSAIADCAAKLILVTADHEPGACIDEQLFSDLDLSILASARPAYAAYARQCRAEYDFSDSIYVKGRSKVLQSLLNKKRIYHSLDCHTHWERAARANIEWELSQLATGATA